MSEDELELRRRRFWCPHLDRTEVDEEGQALCLNCGGLLQVQLTPRVLERAFRAVLERRPSSH